MKFEQSPAGEFMAVRREMRAVLGAVGRRRRRASTKGMRSACRCAIRRSSRRLQREQQLRVVRADELVDLVDECSVGSGTVTGGRRYLDIGCRRQSRQPQVPDQPAVLDQELQRFRHRLALEGRACRRRRSRNRACGSGHSGRWCCCPCGRCRCRTEQHDDGGTNRRPNPLQPEIFLIGAVAGDTGIDDRELRSACCGAGR